MLIEHIEIKAIENLKLNIDLKCLQLKCSTTVKEKCIHKTPFNGLYILFSGVLDSKNTFEEL